MPGARPEADAERRIFGLLTQFGLRISFTRVRRPDTMELRAPRSSEVWRESIASHLEQIDELQQRIAPIDRIEAARSGRTRQFAS